MALKAAVAEVEVVPVATKSDGVPVAVSDEPHLVLASPVSILDEPVISIPKVVTRWSYVANDAPLASTSCFVKIGCSTFFPSASNDEPVNPSSTALFDVMCLLH